MQIPAYIFETLCLLHELSPHFRDLQFLLCDIILILSELIRQMILKGLKLAYHFPLHV
jgi:hypothetical protein